MRVRRRLVLATPPVRVVLAFQSDAPEALAQIRAFAAAVQAAFDRRRSGEPRAA